jgi:hypothetical protein
MCFQEKSFKSFAQNWPKLPKIVPNRRKLAQIAEHWPKSPKFGPNCQKWAKIGENHSHNIGRRLRQRAGKTSNEISSLKTTTTTATTTTTTAAAPAASTSAAVTRPKPKHNRRHKHGKKQAAAAEAANKTAVQGSMLQNSISAENFLDNFYTEILDNFQPKTTSKKIVRVLWTTSCPYYWILRHFKIKYKVIYIF